MRDVVSLQRDLHGVATEMRAIVSEYEKSGKYADGQEAKYGELRAKANRINDELTRELELNALEMASARPVKEERSSSKASDMYDTLGQYLNDLAVEKYEHRTAQRLAEYRASTQEMGQGSLGGNLIPRQFMPKIFEVMDGASSVLSKCAMLPSDGSAPDAPIEWPMFDQSGSKGYYGGIAVTRHSEGAAITQTDGAFRIAEQRPEEVSAYIVATNKLLLNAPEMANFFLTRMQRAGAASDDAAVFTGNGTKGFKGILHSGAKLNVTRNTSSTILYEDVLAMDEKIMLGAEGARYVWLAAISAKTKLRLMKDGGNNLVWQQQAISGAPEALLGHPIIWLDKLPALGSEGDLMLVNLDYYLVRRGHAIQTMIDPYSSSTNLLSKIIMNYSIGGMPAIDHSILCNDGVTYVSPFVVLK